MEGNAKGKSRGRELLHVQRRVGDLGAGYDLDREVDLDHGRRDVEPQASGVRAGEDVAHVAVQMPAVHSCAGSEAGWAKGALRFARGRQEGRLLSREFGEATHWYSTLPGMLKSPPEVRPLPRIYLQEWYPHNKPLDGKVLRGKLERNGAGGVLVALEDSSKHGVEDGRVDHHGPLVLAAEVGIGRAEAV